MQRPVDAFVLKAFVYKAVIYYFQLDSRMINAFDILNFSDLIIPY